MQKLDKKSLWTRLLTVIAIVILLNFIASLLYKRFDLTSERRYSLSESTKNLLDEYKGKVYIKVYLEGELQTGFLRLRNSTEDILKEMNSESGGKIQYDFVNPIKNATNEEEKVKIYQELSAKGLIGTNLKLKTDEGYSESIIFPCLTVTVNGQTWPVQILENQVGFSPEETLNNSVISLEYKIANAIKKLTNKKTYAIGFMQGHGELAPEQTQDLARTLQENKYEVGYFDVTRKVKSSQGDSLGTWIPNDINLLIIARPRVPFTEVEKYRLDQYVMNGGKILWALDPIDAKMDYLRNEGNMFMAHSIPVNLEDMLFTYGVRVNNNLVQDGQLSAPIPILDKSNGEPLLFPWLFYPLLTPSRVHPIGKNLDPIYSQFCSGMDLIENDIKKTVILSTSQYGRAMPEPIRVHLSSIKEKLDFKYFKQPNIPTGVLLEGKFKSVYKNRVDLDFIQKLKSAGVENKDISSDNKMIVLSDADILRNDFTQKGELYPMGYDMYSRQTFANRDFVLNCIEYLVDPSNLLEARNKEIKVRMLDSKRIKTEATKWQMINLLVPFVLVAAFALIYHYVRKRKWAMDKE